MDFKVKTVDFFNFILIVFQDNAVDEICAVYFILGTEKIFTASVPTTAS